MELAQQSDEILERELEDELSPNPDGIYVCRHRRRLTYKGILSIEGLPGNTKRKYDRYKNRHDLKRTLLQAKLNLQRYTADLPLLGLVEAIDKIDL